MLLVPYSIARWPKYYGKLFCLVYYENLISKYENYFSSGEHFAIYENNFVTVETIF